MCMNDFERRASFELFTASDSLLSSGAGSAGLTEAHWGGHTFDLSTVMSES